MLSCSLKANITAAQQYFELLNSQPRLASKVDALIDSILQNPESGIGKPEQLRHQSLNLWSRRISVRDRLIYQFTDDVSYIIQLMEHYKGR